MGNAIAPALAVPDNVRAQALELLTLAAEILERVEPIMRLVGTLDDATAALADGDQPALPPGTWDPQAVRNDAWVEASGYDLARTALHACAETLSPDLSVGEDQLNVEQAAGLLYAIRLHLTEDDR